MKEPHLPAIDDIIHRLYHELVDDLDVEIQRLNKALPQNILQCRPGCSGCCIPFSVFSLEAAHIRRHCLPKGHGRAAGHCSFLENDRCTIYACRPLLCRTQGLPIGYRGDGGVVEVSACPENFADDFVFTEETLLFMDSFNARLAGLNEDYCRQAGLDIRQRIPLSQLHP